ncbi:MAG: DNA repair protein RecO [Lachnospiraceae bacterium]|nr:DNA repair protein RecO [Lachnospiraceae bacterium]
MDHIVLTKGMVLKQTPIGEFDRRVEILTVDRGRITAFARGARRQGGKLTATTDFFCFGDFKLYPGREAYTLSDANITDFFIELRNDFEATLYGMYFLEVAQFNTRENIPEKELLKTLYLALKKCTSGQMEKSLIKLVYELKVMGLMGEYKKSERIDLLPATKYAEQFILATEPEKLFSFTLVPEAKHQLKLIIDREKARLWQHTFKSEEMLEPFL